MNFEKDHALLSNKEQAETGYPAQIPLNSFEVARQTDKVAKELYLYKQATANLSGEMGAIHRAMLSHSIYQARYRLSILENMSNHMFDSSATELLQNKPEQGV
ncbi:MAG: hypothetical protein ACR2FM_02110 [Candidatus Saccharimonadales bacterium]